MYFCCSRCEWKQLLHHQSQWSVWRTSLRMMMTSRCLLGQWRMSVCILNCDVQLSLLFHTAWYLLNNRLSAVSVTFLKGYCGWSNCSTVCVLHPRYLPCYGARPADNFLLILLNFTYHQCELYIICFLLLLCRADKVKKLKVDVKKKVHKRKHEVDTDEDVKPTKPVCSCACCAVILVYLCLRWPVSMNPVYRGSNLNRCW